nr:hypothetical protein [uncultured Methanoregula sp.]
MDTFRDHCLSIVLPSRCGKESIPHGIILKNVRNAIRLVVPGRRSRLIFLVKKCSFLLVCDSDMGLTGRTAGVSQEAWCGTPFSVQLSCMCMDAV